MQLKLMNVSIDKWEEAANRAMQLEHTLTKEGIRRGIGIYTNDQYYYIYKTKTQIVVRCE